MFAPGTKIVKRDAERTSYVITKDSMCEPAEVQVWFEGKGFCDLPRTEIFDDIVAGAYVTNVRHNVTSLEQLKSSVSWAVKETLNRWGFLNPAGQDFGTMTKIRESVCREVLDRVGRDLLVDVDYEDMTAEINGGKFYLQRMIRSMVNDYYEEKAR